MKYSPWMMESLDTISCGLSAAASSCDKLKTSAWIVARETALLNSYCSRSEDPAIAASFAADEDRARQLARLLSHSLEWQPTAGSEAMTANAVNQILINVLQGIDRCVALCVHLFSVMALCLLTDGTCTCTSLQMGVADEPYKSNAQTLSCSHASMFRLAGS